jgi:hypothetical protein
LPTQEILIMSSDHVVGEGTRCAEPRTMNLEPNLEP